MNKRMNDLQKFTGYNQGGLTLVEVMLACTLGLFLISGLIQVYITCKKSFDLQQAIVSLQENGRYAVHFLNQNMRMAGYSGCESSTPFVNSETAIVGYENALPAVLQGKVINDTDSVIVGSCHLEDGKQRYKQYAFFISSTSRKNRLGKKVTALYEMPVDGNKRELVPGVERMELRYGVGALDGKNIAAYEPADQIKDWRQIRAVEISLLLVSPEPVLAKAEPYQFMDKIMPSDRYLHREWNSYIALREKLG